MMLSSKDRLRAISAILSKAPSTGMDSELKRKNEEAMVGMNKPSDEFSEVLQSAASALLSAIESKDAPTVAQAFHEMFKACEVAPHDEYDHDEDE